MFWSDQHGVRIQFVGRSEPVDRIEVEGEPEVPDFTAWLMRGERPVGVLIAGRPQALPDVRRRIVAANANLTALWTAA
jgi:3-phenylpropionate/trans-cinnamate dioxygenase ferredoxin reductase component